MIMTITTQATKIQGGCAFEATGIRPGIVGG